jgi:hypothetical protein
VRNLGPVHVPYVGTFREANLDYWPREYHVRFEGGNMYPLYPDEVA